MPEIARSRQQNTKQNAAINKRTIRSIKSTTKAKIFAAKNKHSNNNDEWTIFHMYICIYVHIYIDISDMVEKPRLLNKWLERTVNVNSLKVNSTLTELY